MKFTSRSSILRAFQLTWAWGIVLAGSNLAQACAVCFGDPDSDMVKGAKAGVWVMVGVVYSLLLTMVGIAVAWGLKARQRAAQIYGPGNFAVFHSPDD